jgi:hypothetical protein
MAMSAVASQTGKPRNVLVLEPEGEEDAGEKAIVRETGPPLTVTLPDGGFAEYPETVPIVNE